MSNLDTSRRYLMGMFKSKICHGRLEVQLVVGGPSPGTTNVIQYITIAQTGDAQDFGDLTVDNMDAGACSNPV